MSSKVVNFVIDGQTCMAEEGMYLHKAAKENGIYIPSLCNIEGVKPRGSCRICSVKVNGRFMTSCTTPVTEGMQIENDTPEIRDLRKSIIELLFVEGNHFCPSCEKSGDCELQALAYKFQMMVPRYPFQFNNREIDASNPKFIKDHNRCILCKRCVRGIRDNDGKQIFAYRKRGHKLEISIDETLSERMTHEMALKAMEICPVGSIIVREKGFEKPIGERKYDKKPIGSEMENVK